MSVYYEEIENDTKKIAILIRSAYSSEGIKFFTSNDNPQQLAYMNHPKGKIIQAHIHNKVKREITDTQEIFIIKKGELRIDFYSEKQIYICSRILEPGDVVLVLSGGHGFEILKDVEMFEIKQGPYLGEKDKVRFENVSLCQE
jgi:mannose-6-phosphate isomerase-like protein (cupin superfamily)